MNSAWGDPLGCLWKSLQNFNFAVATMHGKSLLCKENAVQPTAEWLLTRCEDPLTYPTRGGAEPNRAPAETLT